MDPFEDVVVDISSTKVNAVLRQLEISKQKGILQIIKFIDDKISPKILIYNNQSWIKSIRFLYFLQETAKRQ